MTYAHGRSSNAARRRVMASRNRDLTVLHMVLWGFRVELDVKDAARLLHTMHKLTNLSIAVYRLDPSLLDGLDVLNRPAPFACHLHARRMREGDALMRSVFHASVWRATKRTSNTCATWLRLVIRFGLPLQAYEPFFCIFKTCRDSSCMPATVHHRQQRRLSSSMTMPVHRRRKSVRG